MTNLLKWSSLDVGVEGQVVTDCHDYILLELTTVFKDLTMQGALVNKGLEF